MGAISGVIAWGNQYAILYKQGLTEPVVTEFEAVRPELEREIREKKLRVAMHAKLDQMHRQAQIDNLLEGKVQSGVVPASSSGRQASGAVPAYK